MGESFVDHLCTDTSWFDIHSVFPTPHVKIQHGSVTSCSYPSYVLCVHWENDGEKVEVGSQYLVVNALSSTMVDVPIITMKRSSISVHL